MDETPAESAGRRPVTGFTRWFLLTGNRLTVSLVILIGIGAAFVVVGGLGLATVTTPRVQLSTMIETNDAEQINQLRQLRRKREADISDAVHKSIDDLIDRLQEIDIARQYFKSIYLQ